MNATRGQVTGEEVAAVRAVGWTDAAIWEANTVCALFQFYNSWVDAAGVAPLPPAAAAESGRRLAAHGYAG